MPSTSTNRTRLCSSSWYLSPTIFCFTMAPSTAPLMKGYLPFRIALPPSIPGNNRTREDTFLFAKEHRGGGSGSGNKPNQRTLFIVNVPYVPRIRTTLLLKSIFGRYGDVERVTVVRNPRDVGAASAASAAFANEGDDADDDQQQQQDGGGDAKLFDDQMQLFADPHHINFVDHNDEGKFAHVVFASNKDMKRAVKAMGKLMGGDFDEDGLPPAAKVGALEIQELAESSAKLLKREQLGYVAGSVEDEDGSESEEDGYAKGRKKKKKAKTGIHALADQQRSVYVKRRKLMESCNAIMEEYEDAEDDAEARARSAASQPDGDGFVTVVSSKGPAMGGELEEDDIGGAIGEGRRKGSKRRRKKKEARGSSELKDFYRFQTKETRKKGLQEFRQRFESDLAKVKKLKEEKAYRAWPSNEAMR